MSFDHSVPRRLPAPLVASLALLLAVAGLSLACGHKKPPKPPPSKVPQRVDVKVHQRGGEAIVSFNYPTTTISGTTLDGVGGVEIWRLAQEVPDFALELLAADELRREEAQQLLDELGLSLYETPAVPPVAGGEEPPTEAGVAAAESADTEADERDDADAAADADADADADAETRSEGEAAPELSEEEQLQVRIDAARNLLRSTPTAKSSFIQASVKDFRDDAELWLELDGRDVDSMLLGDRVVLRLPLPPRPSEGPEVGYVIGARVSSLGGKKSDFSNLVSLLPETTPPAPQAVAVAAQADGVHVTWTAEADPKSGFRVYRREAQTRAYGEPAGTVAATERSYVDRQAVFGGRYIYAVTSVASTTPLLESDISSEHEIDFQDRFGPATPSGLVAFPETGRVRLLWTTVADADLAGYEVLRRSAGEDEARVVTPDLVTGGQYLDAGLASGEYFYSVRAVDQIGNRSAASVETPARVP